MKLSSLKLQSINNKKGSALIFSYMVIATLLTLSAGFAMSTVMELNNARRYRDSTAAFWLAEAGVQQFIQNTALLDSGPQTYYYGANYIYISKIDTDPQERLVTVSGTVNGITRSVQVEFPAQPPSLFENTMSSGAGIFLNGAFAKLDVFGKTRLTGSFVKSGINATGWFENKQEGISSTLTTLKYPDANNNGTPDEFNDFVAHNRAIVASYPSNEVVYIQSNSTMTIVPNSALVGKKIVYVEGTSAGKGDINIIFDGTWQANQNLTVISTGQVNYVQPLQTHADSTLNVIAWTKYYEPSFILSTHTGVSYSHGDAEYFEVFDTSETNGNLIANEGIKATEVIAWKKFIYNNPVVNGMVPAGFNGLVSQGGGGYSSTPSSWREL